MRFEELFNANLNPEILIKGTKLSNYPEKPDFNELNFVIITKYLEGWKLDFWTDFFSF